MGPLTICAELSFLKLPIFLFSGTLWPRSKRRSGNLGAKAVHTESAAKVRFGRFWDSAKNRTASQNMTQHCVVLTGKIAQQDRKIAQQAVVKCTSPGFSVYVFRFSEHTEMSNKKMRSAFVSPSGFELSQFELSELTPGQFFICEISGKSVLEKGG